MSAVKCDDAGERMKLRRRRGRNKSGVKQKAEERAGAGGRALALR